MLKKPLELGMQDKFTVARSRVNVWLNALELVQ